MQEKVSSSRHYVSLRREVPVSRESHHTILDMATKSILELETLVRFWMQ
jgi:hypothetical protein